MLDTNDLGNVIHEHLEYYSYKALVNLLERNGLEIYQVRENDINGGSYQLYIQHLNEGSCEYEENCSVDRYADWKTSYYRTFTKKIVVRSNTYRIYPH